VELDPHNLKVSCSKLVVRMGDPFKIVNKIILLRLVIDNQWIYFTLVSYHEEQRQEKSKNINKRNAIY
jgi:hypothetical protein